MRRLASRCDHPTILHALLRFGVDGLIRLHADDYTMLGQVGRMFVHFNLVPTIAEARVLSVSAIVSRNNGFRTHATAAL